MEQGWQKYIETLEKRMSSLEDKMDQMLQFKWQIVGGSIVVSIIFQIITMFFHK